MVSIHFVGSAAGRGLEKMFPFLRNCVQTVNFENIFDTFFAVAGAALWQGPRGGGASIPGLI